MDASAYLSQLRALLPPGAALLREPGGRVERVLGVAAAELARVDARAAAVREEADPRTAAEMIADWERLLGLPDEATQRRLGLAQPRRRLPEAAAGRDLDKGLQLPKVQVDAHVIDPDLLSQK